MLQFNKHPICDGVNFNNIVDNRFKTESIAIICFFPLLKQTAAKNAILPYILKRRSKKHPSFTKLNMKLSELYGASVYANVFKQGDMQAFALSASYISNKYTIDKENISVEVTKLLCEMFFNPVLDENGDFHIEDLNQEKRQLSERIDSEYNDKRIFAKFKCEELMCKDENYGVNRYGTKEDVLNLTGKDIKEAYKSALKNAKIEIIKIGSSISCSSYEEFKSCFLDIKRQPFDNIGTKIIKEAHGVHEYSDTMEVSQCKLVLGFRTNSYGSFKDTISTQLMCAIYGGTPHSKLFLNVREKMSLCYYCSSSYNRHKGILLVQSGVQSQNVQRARDEIINQLNLIKDGNFSDEELLYAKMSMKNSFKTTNDYLNILESFYISQIFDKEIFTTEMISNEIDKITKDDIISAAKKVTLDTVYTLRAC